MCQIHWVISSMDDNTQLCSCVLILPSLLILDHGHILRNQKRIREIYFLTPKTQCFQVET